MKKNLTKILLIIGGALATAGTAIVLAINEKNKKAETAGTPVTKKLARQLTKDLKTELRKEKRENLKLKKQLKKNAKK